MCVAKLLPARDAFELPGGEYALELWAADFVFVAEIPIFRIMDDLATSTYLSGSGGEQELLPGPDQVVARGLGLYIFPRHGNTQDAAPQGSDHVLVTLVYLIATPALLARSETFGHPPESLSEYAHECMIAKEHPRGQIFLQGAVCNHDESHRHHSQNGFLRELVALFMREVDDIAYDFHISCQKRNTEAGHSTVHAIVPLGGEECTDGCIQGGGGVIVVEEKIEDFRFNF